MYNYSGYNAYTQYQYRSNPQVVYSATGDVNGDGISDNIYLTGNITTDSPFTQNITLVVQDGRTGQYIPVALEQNAGYNPTLFLGDFTGNGVNDVMISITSGGSGGVTYYYIYSFVNKAPQKLFDFNTFNELFKYEVTYRDNYLVEVVNINLNTKFYISLLYKGNDYLAEIYTDKGKLKAPISGFVNPLSGLYPIDYDQNGVFELLAFQRIAGRYNADALGYLQTSLKWNGQSFALFNQEVAVPGTNI